MQTKQYITIGSGKQIKEGAGVKRTGCRSAFSSVPYQQSLFSHSSITPRRIQLISSLIPIISREIRQDLVDIHPLPHTRETRERSTENFIDTPLFALFT